jgi:hypothetical protein
MWRCVGALLLRPLRLLRLLVWWCGGASAHRCGGAPALMCQCVGAQCKQRSGQVLVLKRLTSAVFLHLWQCFCPDPHWIKTQEIETLVGVWEMRASSILVDLSRSICWRGRCGPPVLSRCAQLRSRGFRPDKWLLRCCPARKRWGLGGGGVATTTTTSMEIYTLQSVPPPHPPTPHAPVPPRFSSVPRLPLPSLPTPAILLTHHCPRPHSRPYHHPHPRPHPHLRPLSEP